WGVGGGGARGLVAGLGSGVLVLGGNLVEEGVGFGGRGEFQLVERVEQPPHADAVAVVAPRVVAVRLRLAGLRRVVAEPSAESEPLDIGGEHKGEALAAPPAVVLALGERNGVVSAGPREKRPFFYCAGGEAPEFTGTLP